MSNAPYVLTRARSGYRLGDGMLPRPRPPRRPRVDLRRPAHGRAGFGGRARARNHARRSGRVGLPVAPARDTGRSTTVSSPRRSSRSTTSSWTRPRAGTRRWKGSPGSSRFSTPAGRRRPATHRGQRRRGCARRHERGVREGTRYRCPRDDRLAGVRRRRVRLPRSHARRCRRPSPREGGEADRGREARRGERSLLLGGRQLGQDARRRSRAGERERGAPSPSDIRSAPPAPGSWGR